MPRAFLPLILAAAVLAGAPPLTAQVRVAISAPWGGVVQTLDGSWEALVDEFGTAVVPDSLVGTALQVIVIGHQRRVFVVPEGPATLSFAPETRMVAISGQDPATTAKVADPGRFRIERDSTRVRGSFGREHWLQTWAMVLEFDDACSDRLDPRLHSTRWVHTIWVEDQESCEETAPESLRVPLVLEPGTHHIHYVGPDSAEYVNLVVPGR